MITKTLTLAQLESKSLSEMTKKEEKAYWFLIAKKFLKRHVKPGTIVYTSINHVSSSGMARDIGVHIVHKGEIVTISGYVARILDLKWDVRGCGGVRVSGCGMDMGFHLVNALSYALHGYKDKNVPVEYQGRPFRATRKAYRAGYSLEHRWI